MTVHSRCTVHVDWSRHGTFDRPYEDVTSYVLDADDITVSWGRTEARSTEPAGSGTTTVALLNRGREFSPENTLSPIAGKVLPGRRLLLLGAVGPYTYPLWDGPIDQIDVDPDAATLAATLTCLDGWGKPGAEKLSTRLYRGLRTGDLIHVVLDEIGWVGGRDIDPGATVVPWWWEEGTDAATAVNRLVDSEGPPAVAYVQGGVFVFRDRHHRVLDARSTASQGTYTHVVPAGSGPPDDFKILKGSFRYDHGHRNIINTVSIEVTERVIGESGTQVWSTDSPITIRADTTIPISVTLGEPFYDAIVPVSGVDFTSIGGTVTLTLSRTSGQAVTIFAHAAGADAVLNTLALRATPILAGPTYKIEAEDMSSVSTYGRATWGREVPWAHPYDAQVIAERLVTFYASNRPIVTLAVANINADYLAQIMSRTVGDRVTIRNDRMGINADFHIERVTHAIKKLGLVHRLELGCQSVGPTQPANQLTFDVAGKGFNQGAFSVPGLDSASNVLRFDVAGQGFNVGAFAS